MDTCLYNSGINGNIGTSGNIENNVKTPNLEMLTLTALLRIPRRVLQFETRLKQPWKPCRVEVRQGWITVMDGKKKVVCKEQLHRLNCHIFYNTIVIQAQNARFKLRPYSGSEKKFSIFKNIIESRWDLVEPAEGSEFSSLADSKEIKPNDGFQNNKYSKASPEIQENRHNGFSKETGYCNIRTNKTGKSENLTDVSFEPTKILIHEKTTQSRKVGVSSYQIKQEEIEQGRTYAYRIGNKSDNINEENNNVKPEKKSLDQNENFDNKPNFKEFNGTKTKVSKPVSEQKCLNNLKIDIKNMETSFDKIETTIDNDIESGDGIKNSGNIVERTIFNEIDTNNIDKSANVIEKTTNKVNRRRFISGDSQSKKKLSDQFEKAMKNFDDQINIFKSLSIRNERELFEDTTQNKVEESRGRSTTRRITTDRVRHLSREKSREKIRNKTILHNEDNIVLKIYFN